MDNSYGAAFTITMLFLGVVLVYISWDLDGKLRDCNDMALKNSNKLILALGSMLFAFSLASLRCSRADSVGVPFYLIVSMILGVVLLVLGSIVTARSTGTCFNSGSPSIVWIIGVVMILGSGFGLYNKYLLAERR